MVCSEAYPCYVRVGEMGVEDIVELPTETDGTMLLSTITAQFPDAIGLRFKGESGTWRGVRIIDGVLNVPLEGWGDADYSITKSAGKRKLDSDGGPKNKKELLQDLIVLGLPYTSTEEDLNEYFSKFGELAHCEIKLDPETNKSKGFGFVRFTEVDAVEKVLAEAHTIGGRKCDVNYPKRESRKGLGGKDGVPTKLFIGRLPQGTTTEDLIETFSEYGPLKDVYIPNNFRGFGFVTFPSQYAANAATSTCHILKGNTLNVTYPSPKGGEAGMQMPQGGPQQQQYGNGNMRGNMQGGNMPGNMQGNLQGNRQGNMPGFRGGMQGSWQGNMRQQMQTRKGGWYGRQQPNSGYTKGSFQSAGKTHGGKTV